MVASSGIPYKFAQPWGSGAVSGQVTNPIPVTAAGAAASQQQGFPLITATNPGAGGIPPNFADENGCLFYETSWTQWFQAGGPVPYDATFQTNIGGYPDGARVASSVNPGVQWLSLVDNNMSDPDTGGANWHDLHIILGSMSGGIPALIAGGAIANLGFTPVQQGGGVGQGTNKIYVGWDGSSYVKLTVDTTDEGGIITNTRGLGGVLTGTLPNPGLASGAAVANIGFIPVQQGGGFFQGTDKVYIGWTGSSLAVTVDSSDEGNFILTSTTLGGVLVGNLPNPTGLTNRGYHDVTSGRALNTPYTNSQPFEIIVIATFNTNSFQGVNIRVNGGIVAVIGNSAGGPANGQIPCTFPVPSGSSYEFDSSSTTINTVMEYY